MIIPSFRACTGLPPINHMLLEHKVPQLMATVSQPTAMLPVTKKTPMKALNGHKINGTSHVTNGTSRVTNGASHVTNGLGHVTNGTTPAVHVLG